MAAATHAPDRLPQRALALLLLAHVVVWTLVPALTYRTLPQDTLEGLAWGRLWQFGYDKHPFLAPWLTALFTDGVGVVGWPAFLAAQLAVAACYWGVWRLARSWLAPWDAFNAVAVLEGIHYYTVSSFTFNPNLLMLPAWSWTTYAVWRAVQRPDAWRWAAAGLAGGLALDAKYSAGLLFAALGIALLATRRGRAALATPGFAACVLAAALAFAPNLAWLVQHDFLPLRYAADSLDAARPGRWHTAGLFLAEQGASALPALALFALAYGWRRPRRGVAGFDDVYLLAAAFGPLLLTLLIALLFDTALVARWGFPYLSWTGVVLLRWTGPPAADADAPAAAAARARVPRSTRRLAPGIAAITLLLACANYWIIEVEPLRTGRIRYSMSFPARPLAELVTRRWQQRYGAPLRYVAAQRWTAAAVCAYSTDRPAPYFDWAPVENPWFDPIRFERSGAAFVVQLQGPGDEQAIDVLQQRYPRLEGGERIALAPLSRAPLAPVRFWVAFLPPRPQP